MTAAGLPAAERRPCPSLCVREGRGGPGGRRRRGGGCAADTGGGALSSGRAGESRRRRRAGPTRQVFTRWLPASGSGGLPAASPGPAASRRPLEAHPRPGEGSPGSCCGPRPCPGDAPGPASLQPPSPRVASAGLPRLGNHKGEGEVRGPPETQILPGHKCGFLGGEAVRGQKCKALSRRLVSGFGAHGLE